MPAPPSRDPASATASPTARLLNIANVLTTVRLVLVPVFLFTLFLHDGHEIRWRILAFVVFAVAMVTDRFDGALARSYGMITEFGKLADPIADKALLGAALIGLSLLHELPWWITVVILVREIGVTFLRFSVLHRGVIPASRGGKLKTLVQAVAIGLFILPLPGHWHTVAWVVMALAIVLTVVTGIDYVTQAVKDTHGQSAGR
ncbi:MAG TPA: CDP-diacylglycerol--glycerol-3-phosphate 3-phosphatidyltransferase [Mycobacterium sp.]|nr:CDP-diacylglycerol--glycerol-3-phosphate 3-phosphatidyltransferase [Mycobacterium sp.]